MSTHDSGTHYENHRRAAELHDKAAHEHWMAANHKGMQDHQTGQEQSRQALEHSREAFAYTTQAQQRGVNQHGFTLFGHDEIATRAHQLWIARGQPHGSPTDDWFKASEQLRSGN